MKRALYPGESPEVEETGRKEGRNHPRRSTRLRQLSTFPSFSNVATAHTNSPLFASLFLRAYTWETWLPIVTARGGRGPPKTRLENRQGRNAQFLRPTSIFPEKKRRGEHPSGGREIIGPIKLEGFYKRAVISLAISFPSPFFDLATACRKV